MRDYVVRRIVGLWLVAMGAWALHSGLRRVPDDERETLACKMVDALEELHVKPTDPREIEAIRLMVRGLVESDHYSPGAIIRVPRVDGVQ